MPALISAVMFVTGGCGFVYGVFGYPPEPLRAEAPSGIDKTALKVGIDAPFFTLESSLGGRVSLGDVVKDKRAVLVFYRGHW